MPSLKIILVSLTKKMWPKVSAYALFGVASALAALVFKEHISDKLSDVVDRETVSSILTILASSMLAVTTFSLSTMVSAYSAATANVTPRATPLITEDKTTQNALSTFLGTFLFSLVGIIALNMGAYEGSGRFILFIVTLAVIVLIVVTLIRWIERLTSLGRVSETSRLVEVAAAKAMKNRARKPTFGCRKLDALPDNLKPGGELAAESSGYVQFLDARALSKLAGQYETDVYVTAMPGKYVTRGTRLALTAISLTAESRKAFLKCFTLADQRTFEQDPRYGLCVLMEIASRAASDAMHDNGTAIDVIARLDRVLEVYAQGRDKTGDTELSRVWIPELRIDDLFNDAFGPLIRNAAKVFEVQLRLQKALVHLGSLDNDYLESARKFSRMALKHSEAGIFLEEDQAELRGIAQRLYTMAGEHFDEAGKINLSDSSPGAVSK